MSAKMCGDLEIDHTLKKETTYQDTESMKANSCPSLKIILVILQGLLK